MSKYEYEYNENVKLSSTPQSLCLILNFNFVNLLKFLKFVKHRKPYYHNFSFKKLETYRPTKCTKLFNLYFESETNKLDLYFELIQDGSKHTGPTHFTDTNEINKREDRIEWGY